MTRGDAESRREHADNKGSFKKILGIITVTCFLWPQISFSLRLVAKDN